MGSAEPSSFGRLLRRYRTAARLTQEELAERAGLSGVPDLLALGADSLTRVVIPVAAGNVGSLA